MSTTQGQALENAIIANPDDLGAHAAYADWLIEQGDPRGEFIQVQLALEDETKPGEERKALQKRERELLDRHQRAWLGQLASIFMNQRELNERQRNSGHFSRCQFARGWLDSMRLVGLNVSSSRALVRATQARMLRRLEITSTDYARAGEYEPGDDVPQGTNNPALYPLIQSNNLSNVRVFQLGDKDDQCHMNGEVAVDLIKKMPRIEEIYLLAHRVDANSLFGLKSLENLRVLQIDHLNSTYPLEVLANNAALGQLTHLLIHPHALEPDDDEAYINLAAVKALVHSQHLKSLNHLQLYLTDIGDRGCEEVVASGILKRLKVLEIAGGCVTDKGAQVLADCPDLKNLELLNISTNRLTEIGVAALRSTKIKLVAANQYDPIDEGEVDDREYLSEGDIE